MKTIKDDCAPGIAKRPCRELTQGMIEVAELLERLYATVGTATQTTPAKAPATNTTGND
jgi:hypothetical protein